jgi:hypothetical protein
LFCEVPNISATKIGKNPQKLYQLIGRNWSKSKYVTNSIFVTFTEDIVPQRVLAFQMLEVSLHNYFNLLIVWRQEIGQWHLHIHSVKTWEKLLKEKEAHFPLWTLPKLRQQMATMLEEHDGSEQIDEMPTMPEWATQGFSYFIQKGIS